MKTSLIISILFFSSLLFSQPTLQWQARYSNGEAIAMAVDKYGNVYVTGYIYDQALTKDYCTIKYSPAGQQLWVQIYNGTANARDEANCISVDDSGNVYVSGESKNIITNEDMVTIKYNTNGVLRWVRIFNTVDGSFEASKSLCLDEDANVYVTGLGYTTIKYDRNGNQKWVAFYYAFGYENVPSKISYKNGFAYVTGLSYSTSTYYDFATIKYNALTGNQDWAVRYNSIGNHYDAATGLVIDNSNNVYVIGNSADSASSNLNALTIKYNSSGTSQWIKRYTGTRSSELKDVILDVNNNLYVTGNCTRTEYDYLTIKYSTSGLEQWVKIYHSGGFNNDFSNSIATDKNNYIYVTGASQFPNPLRYDIVTIKYDTSGNQQWLIQYNSPFSRDDHGKVILVDSLLNIYICGKSYASVTPSDFMTLKYSKITGVINQNEYGYENMLYQNYPNPFNSNTVIEFYLTKESFVSLAIYDLTGRLVSQLISQKLISGIHFVDFNSNNLPSGIYFYNLVAEKISLNKKLIILK